MQRVLLPMYIVHILYLKLLNVYKRFHKLLIIKNMMDRSKIKTNIYKLKFHFELRIYFVFLEETVNSVLKLYLDYLLVFQHQ